MNFLRYVRKLQKKPSKRSVVTNRRPFQLESLEQRLLLAGRIEQVGTRIDVTGSAEADVITMESNGSGHLYIRIQNSGPIVEKTFQGLSSDHTIGVASGAGDDQIRNLTSFRMSAFGDTGNDLIRGGSSDDTLEGHTGDDTLHGRGGDDRIRGWDGNDVIRGNGGNDVLRGGTGSDSIFGDAGFDEIHGDSGILQDYENGEHFSTGDADELFGGSESDRIYGNGGDDLIHGNDGDDFLDGQGGKDQILGHAGNDDLFGGTEIDRIYGHAGDDLIVGDDGNDSLFGHSGNDDIRGGEGNDFVRGHQGNDSISGGFGDDRIMGDQGTDTVDGSNGNDRLHGGLKKDKFDGGDQIFGGAGNDLIVGYFGNDSLSGGHGNDRLIGNQGGDTLDGGDNNDALFGSGGNDVIYGGAGDDVLDGSTGKDHLYGHAGNDRLDGKDGDDMLNGGPGNDRLFGDHPKSKVGGDDLLYGEDGNDNLRGYVGDDSVYGGSGIDKLAGNLGDDYLEDDAGAGNTLVGGPGEDTIQFAFDPGDLHPALAGNKKSLRLAGTDEDFPNSGFTLLTSGRRTWSGTQLSDGRWQYTAAGNVYLDLDGNLRPNPNKDMRLSASGMRLLTDSVALEEESVVDPDSIGFNLQSRTIGNFLDDLKDSTGIGITLPNFRFGIASGMELMGENNDEELPLRESQPYFHASVQIQPSISFGSVSLDPYLYDALNSANGIEVTFIMDPTDPFFFIKAAVPSDNPNSKRPEGGALGFSESGRIPFHPRVELDTWDNKMFGHFFVELDGVPLPSGFSLSGQVLLDLDANDDGRNGVAIKSNVDSMSPEGSFWNKLGDSLGDISVGINGTLSFAKGLDKIKGVPKIVQKVFQEASVEIGSGAIVLDNELNEIHLKAETTNPFADTPLEDVDFLQNRMELVGSVTNIGSANTQFLLDYSVAAGSQSNGFAGDITINNSGASFVGRSEALGQSLYVSGQISPSAVVTMTGTARVGVSFSNADTGRLSAGMYIRIDARASLRAVNFSTSSQLSLSINALKYDAARRRTGFTAELDLKGSIELGSRSNASLSVDADLSLYINDARFRARTAFQVSVGPSGFAFDVSGHRVGVQW